MHYIGITLFMIWHICLSTYDLMRNPNAEITGAYADYYYLRPGHQGGQHHETAGGQAHPVDASDR